MNEFREELLIKLSIPIYALVIGLEILYSYWHDKKYYSTKGILSNVYLTVLNFSLDILIRGVCLGVLWYFYQFKFTEINKEIYPVLLVTSGRPLLSLVLGGACDASFFGGI
jgi:hypothetical protein